MPVDIPLDKITEKWDPFKDCPWCCIPFTKEMVRKARVRRTPVANDTWHWEPHAGRIKYLAKHGWSDPIEIDVGIPPLHCYVDWPIQDGNHRLAAAMLRGDKTISVSVTGSLDYARALFGVDCENR